jgi:hypothetical protein
MDLDLDIGNYTIKDLERFFHLEPGKKYSAVDLEQKEYEMRETLLKSGHVNKRFKKELIDFLSTAKNWLVHVKCPVEKVATSIPNNPRLDNSEYPIKLLPDDRRNEIIERKETPYMNMMAGEYFSGKLNPLATRVISKCLTIDTRFRDNFFSTQSSDFTINLPFRLNKIVSMQLSSIEIPVAFYGISKHYGNNYLYIELSYQESELLPLMIEERVFIIPDGNYNAVDFINKINSIICPKNLDGSFVSPNDFYSYIKFTLDVSESGCGTGKVTLSSYGEKADLIKNIKLDFTLNQQMEEDNVDICLKIGWNLGFTQNVYDGNTTYVSDTLIEPATIRYIYLSIDDFNNSVNNHFITAFNKSVLNPNILARISLKGNYFSLIMENDLNIVTEPRKYFGPVDIQKLRIRLYDDYGRILDMNNANYSFCLVFKMLYDM